MNIRILHCSDSLENYYLCLKEKVAGFTNRGPNTGDVIYLVVKFGKKSFCGARFVLDDITDYKPWSDSDNYVQSFNITKIEYCTPFEISILSQVGGKYWGLKYLQGAKPIKDSVAFELLDKIFIENLRNDLFFFSPESNIEEENVLEEEVVIEDEETAQEVITEVPDLKIDIMGTFQTIHFYNETDKVRGLEVLVNENFYSLFPQFSEKKTVLIPENRLFRTKGFKKNGNNVPGIRTIPDGILIVFNKNSKIPLQINLIEYECYGERKTRGTDKSNFLNSTIIPQLMRFASAFSIITDETTRRKTIESWADKIIDYVNENEDLSTKLINWIKEIKPNIKERSIEREIEKYLIEGFKFNVRVLLIIDELSSEQKATIKNVISSFKLENGESIQFLGYVVRLVQSINIINNKAEYALTVQ